jgi:hypothetical protein
MPLNHAKGKKARSQNIAELIRAGHSPEQAAAIAYKVNGEDEVEFEAEDAFEESKHPRDPSGKFGSGLKKVGGMSVSVGENSPDVSHLSALELRLHNETMRLQNAKTKGERATREVWIKQIEKEIAHEKEHLGLTGNTADDPDLDLTDEELLAALTGDSALELAFDRSMRSVDLDGHMHVESVNISKANVCPYMGSEIPNGAELGLDPTRVYMLYRAASELEAAAPTFENKQLMIKHVGVSAASPQEWLTVGVVSGVHWQAPYLKARLTVWNQKGIDAIESKAQSELSSGYRYKADMTPGIVDGVHYDGIMRQIVGNHVALVTEGRVGPDVFVTDEVPQEFLNMKISVLSAALVAAGLIATDKKPEDVTSLLSEQFALDKAAKDKAAEDAAKAEAEDKAKDEKARDEAAKKIGAKAEDMVKGKDGNWGLGKRGADGELEEMDAEDIDLVTAERGGVKPHVNAGKGMDEAAVAKLVADGIAADRASQSALFQARSEVLPVLGTVAYDTAEQVYGAALTHLKVEHKDVHPSALRALFAASVKNAPKTGVVIGDAATVQTMDKAFPHFNRLSR